MKFKKIYLLAVIVIASQSSYAQYEADALRFSQFKNSNTARFDAIGGSKTSMGGDLSSLYGNPAGLGMFTKSDFSITPGLKLRDNDITINGANSNVTGSNVDLNNVGVVFNTKTYKTGDLQKGVLSLSFGIGYQKKGSFRNDFNFDNTTNQNGLGNYLAQRANNEKVTQVNDLSNLSYNGYYSFLFNQVANSNPLTFTNNTENTAAQSQIIRRTGGSSSVDFSLGMNVSNQLFLGGSIGLASFRYTATETLNEKGLFTDQGNQFDYDVDYIANYDTEGSGINLKLGAILKPTKELNLGLSFETPTWFSVTDNFSEDFNNDLDNLNSSDPYALDYNLRTPLKLNGGLSYFFGKKGFLSADFGFTDYSTIKFTADSKSLEKSTNKEIKNLYKTAINASIGGEIKVSDSFLLRAGYQFQGNPYQNLSNKDYTTDAISGGIGYRFGAYYLDLAYINSNSQLNYSGYSLASGTQPVANIDTRRNDVSLTFGVKF